MVVDPDTGMRLFASGEDLREWLSACEPPTADDCTVLNDGTRIDTVEKGRAYAAEMMEVLRAAHARDAAAAS